MHFVKAQTGLSTKGYRFAYVLCSSTCIIIMLYTSFAYYDKRIRILVAMDAGWHLCLCVCYIIFFDTSIMLAILSYLVSNTLS